MLLTLIPLSVILQLSALANLGIGIGIAEAKNFDGSSVMYGKRERMTDIWFVFGILKYVKTFGNFIGVTWIL
jgi:hypothetical protein